MSVRSSSSSHSNHSSQRSNTSSSRAAATAGGAASSVRSLATSNQASMMAAAAAASGGSSRSSQQSAGGGSTRSVTSSVAYEQLKQLESVLTKERQAREEAERTLVYLQNEKADKDATTKRGEQSERQLQTLLKQLNRVIENPADAGKLRALQRYALEGATSATPSVRSLASSSSSSRSRGSSNNGRRGAPVVVASPAAGGGGAAAAGTAADKAAVSFFENFGRGDQRQMRVMDKAMGKSAGSAAGVASNAMGSSGIAHANHVPAVGSRGGAAQQIPAFTHRRTDLFSTN